MERTRITDTYNEARFRHEAGRFLSLVAEAKTLDEARALMSAHVSTEQFEAHQSVALVHGSPLYVVRDCARALRGMLHRRADQRAGFSVARAIWDLAAGRIRPDLSPAFFAEMTQLIIGLEGRFRFMQPLEPAGPDLRGREAALKRSDELDALWRGVEEIMNRYPGGLDDASVQRRAVRREKLLARLRAAPEDFADWRWQVRHIARDAEALGKMVALTDAEREAIDMARSGRLPFGVTPYYASLMDDDPGSGRDRALRAQVIPTAAYVNHMLANRSDGNCSLDFMLEHDTSPADLVTRRYPAILILKPFNTCPQICVYCQRNWEIEDAMIGGALAEKAVIEEAIGFIEGHPAIKEVLVTGGDPLGLPDDQLLPILRRIAAIPHVDLVRIGTRTPVTLPMRITPELADGLGALRDPGRREVMIVTHVEHPYEVTFDMVRAVDRLRRNGIGVYNQLVYSFYVSRRFEAAKLRMILKVAGIDPYYTFAPKGKEETEVYRVPLARIFQEQKEEARLLPGSRRTDEPVYNVPGLGKNHLRAFQHRDLISVLPNGARVYDFHPWEKGIVPCEPYAGADVPILDYLQRLQDTDEDPDEYETIWYYY
ncbi:MAG: KamA family radical SAM protein [Thermodesulfobacteriota bacterium]